MEYALPIAPDPYDPKQAKKLLAEAGYPNGFDAGEVHPWPPYNSTGEAVVSYLGAIGIKARLRTQERAAFYGALGSKKLKGICMCVNAVPGNASTRLSQVLPKDGGFAYGSWPETDELYAKQLTENDPKKREELLHELQKILQERTASRRSLITGGQAASARASKKPRWRGSISIPGRPRWKT